MVAVKSSLPRRQFDVVVVGAGGAGMRCSLQLANAGLSVAVLSKVFSNPFAHGCGAGRDWRLVGQHERRQLVLAHV